MHIFKIILLVTSLTVAGISFSGCGEAEYSLDQVKALLPNATNAKAEDLINGDISFSTPKLLVVNDQQVVVTTLETTSPLNLEYSIAGGEQKDDFIVDEHTGELAFKQAPQYDSSVAFNNIYDVVVGVTTITGELSTHAMIITVVKDITKVTPLLDYVAKNISVVLGTDIITEVKARPADATSSVTFALSGSDAGLFSISKEGALTFKQPLPVLDDNSEHLFSVSVVITDGYKNMLETSVISIEVVKNPDLIKPILVTQSIDMVENSLVEVTLEVITSGTGVVNKFILNGNDKDFFNLTDTGVLTLKAANDYETLPNSFSILVQVGDDKNNLSRVEEIIVNIKDIDEGFTFVNIGDFTALVGQKNVGQVLATPNTIKNIDTNYTLVQGSLLLEIDNQGVIQFKSSAVKGPSFVVQVEVHSQLNGSKTLGDEFIVNVVDDPTKFPPVINQTYPRSSSVVSPIEVEDVVFYLNATPEGNATTLSYAIGGVDADKFNIDESGALHFAMVYDFDSNSDNIYEIFITVTDEYGNQSTTDVISIVVLEDPNKMIPIITSSTFTVDENSVKDIDIADFTRGNGNIIMYNIVGGADMSHFKYDNKKLSFKSGVDFESPSSSDGSNTYKVVLQVVDDLGNVSEDREIIVNIKEVSEVLTFTSLDSYGITEGISQVGVVSAVPIISMPATVTYSISSGSNIFNIDANSGVLKFNTPPVYVSGNNIFTLTVNAQSQYNGSLTTTDITVKVSSKSYAITFDSNQSEAYLDQNSVVSFPMTATSAAGETLVYSIENYSGSVFSIDSSSGMLTVTTPPYSWSTNSEANIYRATVVATGTVGEPGRRQGILYVNAIDGVPIINTANILSIGENIRSVTELSATSKVNGTLSFSKTGGVDASEFTITGSTLVFTSGSGANYEDPKDTTTNNTYEVEVTVTDSVSNLTYSKMFNVSVTNVAELPTALKYEKVTDQDKGFSSSNNVYIENLVYLKVESDAGWTASTRNYKVQMSAQSFTGNTLTYTMEPSNVNGTTTTINASGEMSISVPKRLSSTEYDTITITVCETLGECNNMFVYLKVYAE